MKKSIASLLAGIMLVACARAPDDEKGGLDDRFRDHGQTYIEALSNEITVADKIIVTEHSFELDIFDTNTGESKIPERLIYGKLELTESQREEFAEIVANMDPVTARGISMCMFAPHHSIEFHKSGSSLSVMEVCFVCDRVEWRKANYLPSGALYEGLAAFIANIGMQPKRDWAKLASEHVNQ